MNPADKFTLQPDSTLTVTANRQGAREILQKTEFARSQRIYDAIIKSADTEFNGLYVIDIYEDGYGQPPTQIDKEAEVSFNALEYVDHSPCRVREFDDGTFTIVRTANPYYFKITTPEYEYAKRSNFIKGIPCDPLGETVLTDGVWLDLHYPKPGNQVLGPVRIPEEDEVVIVLLYDRFVRYAAENDISETDSVGIILVNNGAGILRMQVTDSQPDSETPTVFLARIIDAGNNPISPALPVYGRWSVGTGQIVFAAYTTHGTGVSYVPSIGADPIAVHIYAFQTNAIRAKVTSRKAKDGCYGGTVWIDPTLALDVSDSGSIVEAGVGSAGFNVTLVNLAELEGRTLTGWDLMIPIPGGARAIHTGHFVEQADQDGNAIVHINSLIDRNITFKITNHVVGNTSKYNAKSFSGRVVNAAANLSETHLGTLNGTDNVVAWCTTLAGSELDLPLDGLCANGVISGMTGTSAEDRLIVEFNLTGIIKLRHKEGATESDDGNVQGAFIHNPVADNKWVDQIVTKPICPPETP